MSTLVICRKAEAKCRCSGCHHSEPHPEQKDCSTERAHCALLGIDCICRKTRKKGSGGKRPGAGRKPLTGERKKRQMLVRLTQTNFSAIAEHCAKNNLSKSEAVNKLVESLK